MRKDKTLLSFAVTLKSIVRFYPTREAAYQWASKHMKDSPQSMSITDRYFRLDGKIVVPNEAEIATYEEIEEHGKLEGYGDPVRPNQNYFIGNFH